MAGVVPKRTSGRKKWADNEGYRSCCLSPLRNQMAKDGCPESQVIVAKQLLDEPSGSRRQTKENEEQGVYFLIKASEQGNVEATAILKTCLENGKGITELNYLDVKSCISMNQEEKLACRAAREMFARLSNGGEYITSDLLQKKILAIDRAHVELNPELLYDSESDEDTDWSLKSDVSNEKLTEDNLVAAAVNYSHGLLPVVSRSLVLSEPDLRALDHIPLIQRSVLHPFLAVKILYYKVIKLLARQLANFSFLAKSECQLVFLLLIYTLVSANNLMFFLPMLIYYVTFIVMVVTSCNMLQVSREFYDFRLWSGLFICYSGGSLNNEEAEYQYILNHMKPYWWFFGSLLINLLIYPVISTQWIPQSELMIVAFCLTFMTLLGFLYKRRGKMLFDFLVFLSFGVNVLAKYPYETDPVVAQGWRFLDLKIPTFPSYVIGNGIEFCINFRFFLYLCIPVILVKIASRNNWRGTYMTFIPHCVTLSWLQICIISSEGATMYGLLRGSLALVGFVLFLPLVGLTSIFLPAAALTKWLLSSDLVFNAIIFVLISSVSLVLCRFFARTRFKKFIASLQVFSTMFALVVFLKSTDFKSNSLYYNENKLPEFLSWEAYQRFCHQPIWQDENIAIAQTKCGQLENSFVHWDGYINDVKIKSVQNTLKNIFDKFPGNMRQYLYCFYGEETSNDCDKFPIAVRQECNSFHNAINSVNFCSLQKYDRYKFEISVRMNAGIWSKSPEVTILVDNYFKNFSLSLKPNDHVWFKGTLFNEESVGADGILGGSKIHVRLEEMGCLACSNSKLAIVKREDELQLNFKSIVSGVVLGCKFVFNVLLYPVVFIK